MGTTSSSVKSGTISASKIIAEAFLYVTQDISQGVQNRQIVDINCTESSTNDNCIRCYNALKNFGKLQDLQGVAEKLCSVACTCDINNVDLSQMITVNFSALSDVNIQQKFQDALKNSIYNQAYQQNGNLSLGNNEDTLTKVSNSISTKLQNNSFSDLQQALQNIQVVELDGPGKIYNVQMNQTMDIVSSFFASSSEFSEEISQLENIILSAIEQVSTAGLNQIIMIIVLIVMVIIALVVFGFAFNILVELYTLYTR